MHSPLFKIGRRLVLSLAFCGLIVAFYVLSGSSILAAPTANTSPKPPVALTTVSGSSLGNTRDHAARAVKPKRRAPVILPVVAQKDILIRHQELADSVLRTVNPGCRATLQNFYVRYDNPDQRGLGGGSTIIVSGNVPDDEFRALLVHECGHLVDLSYFNGTASAGPTAFRDGNQIMYGNDPSVAFYSISWIDSHTKNRGAKDADFVSGYASWDAFEDFAETYAYYMLQRDAFAARAQTNNAIRAKYIWMETYVPSAPVGIGTAWDGTVPWDITKLAYRWALAERVAKQ